MSASILSITTACIAFIALAPLAKKYGLVDRPNDRKKHVGNVPLTGGIVITICLWINYLFFDAPSLGALLSVSMICALGVIDDAFDVSADRKLLVQIISALPVCIMSGVTVQSFGTLPDGTVMSLGIFSLPFTIIAMIALINAINMLDGIDGLASGLCLIVLVMIALYGAEGLTPIPSDLMAVSLAVIVFMIFNMGFIPKYKVFLGDAGSMTLGLFVAIAIIRTSQDHIGVPTLPVAIVPWLLAIPITDTMRLIIQRMNNNRSPFAPGRDHFHHLLIAQGFSPRQTLMTILCVAVGVIFVGHELQEIGLVYAVVGFVVFQILFISLCAKLKSRIV